MAIVEVVVVDERRFTAMGTECHVQVLDPPAGALEEAEAMVRADERRWSRFLPDSDVSRINTAAGSAVTVSAETARLVELAVAATDATDGWFDPLVGVQVRAAGYDRSFDDLAASGPVATSDAPPVTGRRPDHRGREVTIPEATLLDLGGIAKGHTGDRVVGLLLSLGAAGACVSIGGDLRAAGASPADTGWWCSLDHRPGVAVGVVDGAVATSTTSRRRWRTAAGPTAHHLIDPRTGRPSTSAVASATVVAADAASAEVLAKVALLAPSEEAAACLGRHGAAALLTLVDGAHRSIGPVGRYLAEEPT